jgi:hypothetical protein
MKGQADKNGMTRNAESVDEFADAQAPKLN